MNPRRTFKNIWWINQSGKLFAFDVRVVMIYEIDAFWSSLGSWMPVGCFLGPSLALGCLLGASWMLSWCLLGDLRNPFMRKLLRTESHKPCFTPLKIKYKLKNHGMVSHSFLPPISPQAGSKKPAWGLVLESFNHLSKHCNKLYLQIH